MSRAYRTAERRDLPPRTGLALEPVETTQVWPVLCDAADAVSASRGDGQRHEREVRAALQAVVDRIDRSVMGLSDAAGASPVTISVEDVQALRAEFLGRMEQSSDGVDASMLARTITAFDGVLHSMDSADGGAGLLSDSDAAEELIQVAHDMQSPLSSILFLADTLRHGRSGPVNNVQERQLGLIYGAAFGLSTIVSDVIDAARGHRLVSGKPRPFSIAETMLHVCAIVRPIAEEKQLTLKTVFPVCDSRVGCAPALGRVLLNLTTNALKFTECGSVVIGCSEISECQVEFWVSDTGVGVPESLQAMLSSELSSAQRRTRFSSPGLGLTICRTLLEALGSSLQFRTGDEGTRFSFVLELPPATSAGS